MEFVVNDNPSMAVVLNNKLHNKYIKNVKTYKNYGKLNFFERNRLQTYFTGNIFDFCGCCLIKKKNNTFAYRGKKVSIHKLLYHNYVDTLEGKKHIVFYCDNKSKCINLAHFDYF